MARRQGALPGLLRAGCPDYSGRWVHLRCTPRLAARQRGILAFMPLTVVGPGRLLVADEAARVRPGDEGCVSPSLAGAAPGPRLQNASGRRPSKLGSGWDTRRVKVKRCQQVFHWWRILNRRDDLALPPWPSRGSLQANSFSW